MKKGKKSISEKIINETLYYIKYKTKKNPILILNKAIKQIQPYIEIRKLRLGSLTYLIPIEINKKRQEKLVITWLLEFIENKKKSKEEISKRLGDELLNSLKNEGELIKRKNELHKLAEMNRVFLHYRWIYNIK